MVRSKREREDVHEEALTPKPKRPKSSHASHDTRLQLRVSPCAHDIGTRDAESFPTNRTSLPIADLVNCVEPATSSPLSAATPSLQPGSSRRYLTTTELQRLSATAPQGATSFPWLRSGRLPGPPLVVAAATMQVQPLSEFELLPLELDDRGGFARSSQSTETEPPSPITTAASQQSSVSGDSFRAWSSQTSTIAPPWASPSTPERRVRSPATPDRPRRFRYTGSQPVGAWFAECYESEGYDSEALALISTPPRDGMRSDGNRELISPSVISSQGFVVVGDTALNSARDEWRPEVWPADVRLLQAQYNPRKWEFPGVAVGVRGGVGCGCNQRCNVGVCLNAKHGRFCTSSNCAFGGVCGNSLKESPALAICRNVRTGMRGLVATEAIPAGEIIGEYLGHLQLFGAPSRTGPANQGYRMRLKTRTTGGKYIGIDALEADGKLRLMNHACKPCARFHEVQTGSDLTVVAVTVRDVFPNEEVTVSYGDQLWLVCRCGWWGGQHRDIQDVPDATTPP